MQRTAFVSQGKRSLEVNLHRLPDETRDGRVNFHEAIHMFLLEQAFVGHLQGDQGDRNACVEDNMCRMRVYVNIELCRRSYVACSRIAPPMMTSSFTALANLGSLRIAMAMFVS